MSGRIAVERGANTVTLVLAQWALKSTATLTRDEAQELIRRVQDALDTRPAPLLPDIL